MTTRRQVLLGGGAAGGALLLGLATLGPDRRQTAASIVAGEGDAQITAWLKIGTDNRITVYVPHSEMGQGVHTSLPMMAAEELNADWDLVDMVQAPAHETWANGPLGKGYLTNGGGVPAALNGVANLASFKLAELMNLQVTGGSTSVRFTGQFGMRQTGAAAKEMLVRAAAQAWGVPPREVTARASYLYHDASGKKATYGTMAGRAAALDVPSTPALKDKKDYTIVGQPVQRFDIPDKVTGKPVYGIDVTLPGMFYGAVLQAPVFGGRVEAVNDEKARAARGVRDVVRLEDAVVVVADNYWRAQKALTLLEVTFSDGGKGDVSSKSIFEQFAKDIQAQEGEADHEKGDPHAVLQAASTQVSADYSVPYLAHATMEPMNCVVRFGEGKCDVWVGTQNGLGTRALVADIAGLSVEDVTVHVPMLGGGFGRRSPGSPNYIEQAVRAAQKAGVPLKLVWSREDDIRHDYYRPAVSARMQAALDDTGLPLAWINKYVRKDEPEEASLVPYAVPNQSIRHVESPTHVPYGPWRSVAHTQHTFFNESFIDELAHASGRDPFVYRRKLLAHRPRHKAVLELAARKAGWDKALPEGRARGIAIQESFQSIVAEVVELSLDGEGRPRVHKVTAAVDCGEVINPDTARCQVEGGIIYGLTAALYGEITIEGGAVVQENFPDYEMIRMADSPEIAVHFIESGAMLGGLGEPGTPPIAPAVANALYALTGKRIRSLPLGNPTFTGEKLASVTAE